MIVLNRNGCGKDREEAPTSFRSVTDNTDFMVEQQTLITRNRGPAPTGKGTLLGVGLHPNALAKLDIWRGEQPNAPTRSEAVRRLTGNGLAS